MDMGLCTPEETLPLSKETQLPPHPAPGESNRKQQTSLLHKEDKMAGTATTFGKPNAGLLLTLSLAAC